MEEHSAELGFDAEDLEPRPLRLPHPRRMLALGGVLGALILMTVLPPLVSVNRYRRQIARSIGASLGRPVHMDAVTLNVLPLPGFTLQNFVVGEDPAFGSEPVIRANSVRVTLRFRSLWRRRVEFSRISLDDPSVNLVHLPDGRWNVESILLQASRIEAAPTAQKGAGAAPRFPYIEATGARVNVKMGLEKMPLSLTDATFALWLPQPRQWRIRLKAHPARTDTAATDTGTLRVEGTLGKAARLQDVPIDLRAEWSAAPLGAVSWMALGRDAGWRGELTLSANVQGTPGENTLEARLGLSGVRRADFVPARTLDVDVACRAHGSGIFHGLGGVRCTWPAATAESGMALTGEIPDVLEPRQAQGSVTLQEVPAAALLDGLRVLSARVAPDLTLTGMLGGTFACCGQAVPLTPGRFTIANARAVIGAENPLLAGNISGEQQGDALSVAPLALNLGGAAPATLTAHADSAGYGMHLSGSVSRTRLMELANALPQFGDGLAEALPPAPATGEVERPMAVDLMSSRSWSGGQVWTPVAAPVPRKKPGRTRRRR